MEHRRLPEGTKVLTAVSTLGIQTWARKRLLRALTEVLLPAEVTVRMAAVILCLTDSTYSGLHQPRTQSPRSATFSVPLPLCLSLCKWKSVCMTVFLPRFQAPGRQSLSCLSWQ